VFTPDGGQESVFNCKQKGWIFEAADNTNRVQPDPRVTYSGPLIPGIGTTTISVGVPHAGTSLAGYAECSWRFQNPTKGIDEETAIDHEGDVNCLAPPTFSIPNFTMQSTDSDGVVHDCDGSISFSAYTLQKLAFIKRHVDTTEFQTAYPSCGICEGDLCTVLCVKTNSTYGLGDVVEEEYSLISSSESNAWHGPDGKWIELVEENGVCYMKLQSVDSPTLDGDLIKITDCALGMNLTAQDETGDWIQISCNPCSCWTRICGTCRCTCRELCVLSYSGGSTITESTLAWDLDNWRWGSYELSVDLGADADDNCEVTSYGFENAASIPNACGNDISFLIEDDITTQISNGYATWLAGYCKKCSPLCDAGDCLSECDNVAQVIQAEVVGYEWQVQGENQVKVPCFDTFTITMVLRYIGTEAAGEWRWIGSAVSGDCEGEKWYMRIDIGCDGEGSFLITNGQSTVNPSADYYLESIQVSVACGVPWDTSFTISNSSVTCCGDNGFFEVTITE
tara:strand:+ start:527 stop:2053 length:1527 start_codon:yes stop_codon:yes gene_type:complete